jgi:hypothetical protein
MSTLLDKAPFPAWVGIIIIVVGSLSVLLIAALIVRCHFLRRTAKRNSSVLDQGPMRRMTVRRGRMVPASNYLSLTGSRFGLNQFDDTEMVKSGRRSPFDWWSNNREKKQYDDTSNMERAGGSVGDIYGRRDFAQSTSSLTSEKNPSNTVQAVEPAFPSPTALPEPDVNRAASFSRPFSPRMVSSSLMHSRNLSMIEEASPHASMISSRSNPRKSELSINAADGSFGRFDERRPSNLSLLSTPSTPSRASRTPSNPEILAPVAYAGSRASLGEIEIPRPSLSPRSSISRHDSVTDLSQSRQPKQPPMPASEPSQEYWSSRPDLQPIGRTPSKKGKVLRKKSLKRQEVYSCVAT